MATSEAVEIPIASQSSLGMSTVSGDRASRPMFASAAAMYAESMSTVQSSI